MGVLNDEQQKRITGSFGNVFNLGAEMFGGMDPAMLIGESIGMRDEPWLEFTQGVAGIEEFKPDTTKKINSYDMSMELGMPEDDAAMLAAREALIKTQEHKQVSVKAVASGRAVEHATKILLELQPELIYEGSRKPALDDVALLNNLAEGFGVTAKEIMSEVKKASLNAEVDRQIQIKEVERAGGDTSGIGDEDQKEVVTSQEVVTDQGASTTPSRAQLVASILNAAYNADGRYGGPTMMSREIGPDGEVIGAVWKDSWVDDTGKRQTMIENFEIWNWLESHLANNQSFKNAIAEENEGRFAMGPATPALAPWEEREMLHEQMEFHFADPAGMNFGKELEAGKQEGGWWAKWKAGFDLNIDSPQTDPTIKRQNNLQSIINDNPHLLGGNILPIQGMSLMDQFKVMATGAMPGIMGRQDLMQSMNNAYLPTLGRFVLQELIGDGKGTWDPLQGLGEQFYQFAGRGFKEGADTFNWTSDKLNSAWKVLADSSMGQKLSATFNPDNEWAPWYHREIANSPNLQVAASMLVGGIQGGGIYANLRRKAFERLTQQYFSDQATASGENRKGLAAWLSEIPGTPWWKAAGNEAQPSEQEFPVS